MMELYLIFQSVRRRCHGNQIMMPNEGKLILCAFFAHSADGRMVLFCYYLLVGDTAALPRISGLYFLIFFTMSKAISISTGQICTIFSPNGRYLREFSRSGPVFLILQGTLP